MLHRTGYLHGRGDRDVGETLAFGTGGPATARRIVAGWIASHQHHRVLLGSAFHEVGVGVAAGVPEPSGRAKGATYTLTTGMIDGG